MVDLHTDGQRHVGRMTLTFDLLQKADIGLRTLHVLNRPYTSVKFEVNRAFRSSQALLRSQSDHHCALVTVT